MEYIKAVRIPRNMTGDRKMEFPELHLFTDASKDAYAAVVYLRNGNSVQLVQAKSRVAPMKKATIPRLELLGCAIGARLLANVKKAFGYEEVPVYCWTDSSTALAWIRRNDEWGTFVGNRVKEICRLTPVESWNHVPGIKNPADLPSRGCTPKELLESRWWEGPEWLKGSRNDWPKLEVQFDENAILAEKKKSAVTAMLHLEPGPIWYVKFSNF